MGEIRIAMCQIVCLDGDRRGNFARIENVVRGAKDGAAELVCLPEMALYGWVNPEAHPRARAIPGEDSDHLCELARRYGVWLCAGLAENEGGTLYDSALLISDTGQIVSKHRKINLLKELMAPPYTPGQEVNVADTRFGRMGLLICADTHERALLEQMAALKPDLVLVPYGYAAEEDAWPGHGKVLERVVTNAAKTIGAAVIGTNLLGQITHGPWKGRTYAGHSVAADKRGEILAVGADFDRDMKIVALSI